MEEMITRIRAIACLLNARVEGARALTEIKYNDKYLNMRQLKEEDVDGCIAELLDVRDGIKHLFDLADEMEQQQWQKKAAG